MSNHLKKDAKLKASTTDIVGPLLKRLELAKKQVPRDSETEEVIDLISTDIENTKDIIVDRGNWDTKLIGYFGEIERQIDYWVDHNKMTEWDETVRDNLRNVHDRLSQNLILKHLKAGTNPSETASEVEEFSIEEFSNRSYQGHKLPMDRKIHMTERDKGFLNSLAIFPENTELKKRFLIYWWTGLGLISSSMLSRGYESIEDHCKYILSELVHEGVLIPVHIRQHNQVVDCYTIEPEIHKQLISTCLTSQEREEGTWHLYGSELKSGLLNRDQRYLNSKDIIEISSKNHFSAVQLGSWRYKKTEVHNGVEEEHIEVDETGFLKKLGEKVIYLSLRGISGIEELRESIGKLENLLILDLRSCHNLESLSQKPNFIMKQKLITQVLPQEKIFEKLMVLDISQCHLLDVMPKWICELYNLEVLKGFVVGGMGNLSNLTKLKKLSIRIGSKHLASEDLSSLKPLNKLLVLTILWGAKKSNDAMPTLSFPKNLEKLDIRCYPEAEASKLLNAKKMKKLKRLYFRGGKLTEIPNSDNWKVEILRLRFLTNLETDWDKIKPSFNNLQYVECVKCPKAKNFPRCRWIKKDEQFQSHNDSETANTKEKDEHFQSNGDIEAAITKEKDEHFQSDDDIEAVNTKEKDEHFQSDDDIEAANTKEKDEHFHGDNDSETANTDHWMKDKDEHFKSDNDNETANTKEKDEHFHSDNDSEITNTKEKDEHFQSDNDNETANTKEKDEHFHSDNDNEITNTKEKDEHFQSDSDSDTANNYRWIWDKYKHFQSENETINQW